MGPGGGWCQYVFSGARGSLEYGAGTNHLQVVTYPPNTVRVWLKYATYERAKVSVKRNKGHPTYFWAGVPGF